MSENEDRTWNPPCMWTNDCQGKKDYDGELISISTRYWPRGGGFTKMFRDTDGIRLEENDARPEIKPSASAKILLRVNLGTGEYGGDLYTRYDNLPVRASDDERLPESIYDTKDLGLAKRRVRS